MSEEPIKIFYSYSRRDLDMRNRLEKHLASLRKANRINTWHDLQLEAGTEWEPAILNKLDTADIILLLVSSDFIDSDYCYGTELKRAIARHNEGTARVIPIILRPCDWNHDYVPFSKLNVLPDHAEPITGWADQDAAFTIVARRIRETVDELTNKRLAEQHRRQELERQRRKEKMKRQLTAGANELASEKGMDYTQLEKLLEAERWQEADQETAERICEVMDRQDEGWLRFEDVQNFPCTDLHTIDQLWIKHSKGQFGFSVQKKIWQECGSPTAYNANWEKFGEAVGWKGKGFLNWKELGGITFYLSAPRGHLPLIYVLDFLAPHPHRALVQGWEEEWCGWCFFSRVEACNL